tara:strand:- start:4164 stop:4472 length:309 start_codon:yes stop_codon:yes gene_type:complete
MSIDRKQIRSLILKEMDMMGMTVDMEAAYNIMMGMFTIASFGSVFVSMLLMLGPIMFSNIIDHYYRGMFTDEEFRHFVELSKTDPEAAKQFAEQIRQRQERR